MIGRWVLPAFALAVSTAYLPFWHDGAVSTKWMTLAGLPLALFLVRPRMTVGHWAGAALIVYAALSALWSPAPLDALNWVLRLALLGAAFLIAAEIDDLRPTYVALVAGVSLSGVLALAEVMDWVSIPEANHPAALFGNRNYLAEMGAVGLVAALGYRVWWAVPGTILALALPMSKAAFLAVGAAALVGLWGRSKPLAAIVLVTCAASGVVASQFVGGFDSLSSLTIRLEIWQTALENLTFFGHGFGSFQSAYVMLHHYEAIPLGRPENAHNEFLNLAFEVGVPGVLAAAIFALAAWRGGLPVERCLLAALAASGMFGFPLHLPTAGFVAAVVAGRLCGHGHRLRHSSRRRRGGVYAGDGGIGPRYGAVGV